MWLVWILFIVGVIFLVVGIIFGAGGGKFASGDPQDRKLQDTMKRNTEILERNRMESYSRSDYFRRDER